MKRTRTAIVAVLALGTASLIMTAAAPAANAAGGLAINAKAVGPAPALAGTVKGGTLNYTGKSDVNHLDPTRCYDTFCMNIGRLLWRTLTGVQLDAKGKQTLVGDLASDVGTPSNGGKTWVFKLRAGVKWEDGQAVTCADLKYGIGRTWDQEAASVVLNGGTSYPQATIENTEGFKGPFATPTKDLSGVTCGKSGSVETITFKLLAATGDFNFQTTMPNYAAVRKDKDTGATYDDKVFSNGPYKIQSRIKKDKTIMVQNTYWDTKTDPIRLQNVEKIDMLLGQDSVNTNNLYIENTGRAVNGIVNGPLAQNVPLIYDSEKDALQPIFENRGYYGKNPYVYWLAINVEKVTDLNLRKAIQCALNVEGMRATVGGKSAGDFTSSLAPVGIGGYSSSTVCGTTAKGDVAKAKAYMAKVKTNKEVTFVYSNATKDSENEALSLQSSLTKAGIKVKIKAIDSTDYYTILEEQGPDAPDLMLYAWGYDWPNASTIYPPLFRSELVGTDLVGENKSRVKDAKLDAMMVSASKETNAAKQTAAWVAIDKYIVNTIAAVVPMWQSKTLLWRGSNVGAQYNPTANSNDWASVYLKNPKL
jgi:peptide/nickel transport system substrate-binding protein